MRTLIISIITICFLSTFQHRPKAANSLIVKAKDTSDAEVSSEKKALDSLKLIHRKLTAQNRLDYILTIDQKRMSPIKDSLDYSFNGRRHQRFVYVPVILENRSNDTLKYLNMTCSRWDIFRVNNGELSCFNTVCEYNVPDIHNVPPKQKEHFVIPLTISRGHGGNRTFKVGLNLQLSVNMAEDWGTAAVKRMSERDAPNIIWSNEVQIP